MCPESDRTCVKLDKGDTCCLNKNIVQQDDPPPPPTEAPEQPSNNEVPPITDKPIDDTPVVTNKPEAAGMHFISPHYGAMCRYTSVNVSIGIAVNVVLC